MGAEAFHGPFTCAGVEEARSSRIPESCSFTPANDSAAVELGHHDSITIPGVTTSYLQAHLQSLVHLH